jgi:hypothetical protein
VISKVVSTVKDTASDLGHAVSNVMPGGDSGKAIGS